LRICPGSASLAPDEPEREEAAMRVDGPSRNRHHERKTNMGKVVTGFSMSLDGFIAGPEDDVQGLFKWYSSGDTEVKVPSGRFVIKASPASTENF
jgi:hypothetical protein